jgi:cephalosporin hydroxylase
MGDIARDILSTADDILVERGKQYGDASLLFSNMAVRFGLVLGIYVSPFQAARLMAELKAARLDLGYQPDHIVDQINYLALAGELKGDQR